ncbi:MAG: HAD family hydrolase [Bariatricus sp.]
MRYKCVVSDLDKTLLNAKSVLSEQTQDALERLIEAGILVVPASGRPFGAFPECIMKMKGIRYAIASNGVALMDVEKQEQIWSLKLKEQVVSLVFELLENCPVTYEAFIDGKAYTGQDYFDCPEAFGVRPEIRSYIQSTRHVVPDIRVFLREHEKELDCMDVIVNPEEKGEVLKRVREAIPGIYVTTSAPHLIEISDEAAGKHAGLKKLLEMLQIDPAETVAFGDGDNDSEMLQEAGLGIAVSNAGELCKAAADRITGSNEEDGVVQALYQIFPEIFGSESDRIG